MAHHNSISFSCEEVIHYRFTCMALLTYDQFDESCTYKEAISSPHSQQWRAAMREEIEAIEANETGTLVTRYDLPPHCRVINSTWVYRLKTNTDGLLCFRTLIKS